MTHKCCRCTRSLRKELAATEAALARVLALCDELRAGGRLYLGWAEVEGMFREAAQINGSADA